MIENRIPPGVRIVQVPNLIYGHLFGNFLAIMKIIRMSNEIGSISVIGADVMDGCYNPRASINRLLLLRVINFLEIESRVTGFSWSQDANPMALKLLRIISENTKLCVRDPGSVERLSSNGVISIKEVADLVFLDQSIEPFPIFDQWSSSSTKPIVVINISGLGNADAIASTEHVAQYACITAFLHSNGYRVLILPHVFRTGDGDLEASTALLHSAGVEDDKMITELFSPGQERYLLRKVSFVVTGRMHVAVMSLSVGTPVIAIETMGKVQGLFDLFELGRYCQDRVTNFGVHVVDKIKLLETEQSLVSKTIASNILSVRQKSLINF
jgi:polysaccharide pyruvyl transferase WcaK-like protein